MVYSREIGLSTNIPRLSERRIVPLKDRLPVVDAGYIRRIRRNRDEPIVTKRMRGLYKDPLMREKALQKAASFCRDSLKIHERLLADSPKEGRDFFAFPPPPSEVTESYKSLSLLDITDFTYSWVHGDLAQKISAEHDPRAIGHFLTTVVGAQEDTFISVLASVAPNPEDPDLMGKIVKRQELAGVVDPEFHRLDTYSFVQSIHRRKENNHDDFNLTRRVDTQAGLSLFKYGIITRPVFKVVNHRWIRTALLDFDSTHVPALQAARICPKVIDDMGGEDSARHVLTVGLMGAQIREFGVPSEDVLEDLMQDGGWQQATRAYLHYFYAPTDGSAIRNDQLKTLLASEISSGWAKEVLRELILTGQPLRERSSIVEKTKEGQIGAENAAELVKTALDAHDGNWNMVNPHIQDIINVSVGEGTITTRTLSQIIAACIGFCCEIPPSIRPYIANPKNWDALSIFPHELDIHRSSTREGELIQYPVNPPYAFLSRGKEALPKTVELVLDLGQATGRLDYSLLGVSLLEKLFDDRYLRYYFGGIVDFYGYPAAQISMKDVEGELWRIVHPDIWDMVSKADQKTLRGFIEEHIPTGKTRIEFFVPEQRMIEDRDTPIEECLPPDILAKIGGLDFLHEPPSSTRPLAKRLRWTMRKPAEREMLATQKRISSTDLVRTVLIPRYQKHEVDILTQIRLIHRAHMRGNEHILLYPNQAQRLLREDIRKVDRLAGVVRTPDKFNINVGLADMMALCASYENTPNLLAMLAQKADDLFPTNGINNAVDEDSIYYYASALQLCIALIHPFYEANGRTSEDAMYILWQRRPDLQHTIRYISADGTRDEDLVEERMEIINNAALDVVRSIGRVLGATEGEMQGIKNYNDFLKLLPAKRQIDTSVIQQAYLALYDEVLVKLILQMGDINELKANPTVAKLAEQLREASSTYKPGASPNKHFKSRIEIFSATVKSDAETEDDT